MAALAALLAVAGALVGALGAADDRPGAGGRPAGAALAVQLDHDLGAQGGVLLVAAHPGGQLPDRAFPGREQAAVEGHKRRVQHGRRRGGGGAWGEAEAVALPGGPQGPVRDAEFFAGLVDADLGGALPGLLGGVAVLVEAGPWRAALEHLRLRQAVVVEGAPQRLLADAQLAGGPVDALLVGQRQRRLGGGAVVQEPGALGHRGAAAQRYAVAGGGAGEDTCVAVAGWGAWPGSGKNSSGSTSAQAASSRQSRSPSARWTGGGGLASCWWVAASRSARGGWPWRVRSCQVRWRT